MSTAVDSATITRLEKAAVDNGFDQELPRVGDWLGFASSQTPLRLWLTLYGNAVFIAAFSQSNVAKALDGFGTPAAAPLPPGAVAARTVVDVPSLHQLVRRAFQLSRSLPDELLHVFEAKIAGLPRATEVERLVVQRVGQDIFRAGLMDYWQGRCAVTGLSVLELLRASHIKPWAACTTDAERLDVFNGLLLAPHLDALFDAGFISLEDDGTVLVTRRLSDSDRILLGIETPRRVRGLAHQHLRYLDWHRQREFKR